MPSQAMSNLEVNQDTISQVSNLSPTPTNVNIVWRDISTGNTLMWFMEGNNKISLMGWSNLPQVPANWRIEKLADFNQDGRTDMLWRDYQTGENVLWFMGSNYETPIASWTNLLPVPPSAKIEGVADFNQDGRIDIVWRDYATGTNVVWYMGGTDGATITGWNTLQLIPTNWQIEGVADFNQDGRTDIVWRDYLTGQNVVWHMGGTNGTSMINWSALQSVTTNWQIEGLSDFNQDGQADLLWRDYATGTNIVWYMGGTNGSSIINWDSLLSVSTNWAAIPFNTNLDWYDYNILGLDLNQLTRTSLADGQLTRNEMMNLLRSTENEGTITATELSDLSNIVNRLYNKMPDYVQNLAQKVVNGNVANLTSYYQGVLLGNLTAGSNSTRMKGLVQKWFLGTDRPMSAANYQYVNGSLFANGISYTDVQQGRIGDCYYMAALAGAALRSPSTIQSMFIDNGDNTFTIRFYNSGVRDYVTVDRYLPVTLDGSSYYAGWGGGSYSSSSNELWVALAEKAYAQVNQEGWLGQNGTNTYLGIEGGWSDEALRHVTAQNTVRNIPPDLPLAESDRINMINQFNAGRTVLVDWLQADFRRVDWQNTLALHGLTMVGYDAASQLFTIYNPWGATYNLTWQQMSEGFEFSPGQGAVFVRWFHSTS
jgi:hypothetical protein